MLENTSFKNLIRANYKKKSPKLILSGYIHFDEEDLDVFTSLTHLTSIQSIFLMPAAVPIIDLIPRLTDLEALSLNTARIVLDPHPFFQNLTKLTTLAIHVHSSASIKADDIRGMTRLNDLHIMFKEESKFPISLLALDLRQLKLKNVHDIPASITKLTRLESLNLSEYEGTLPTELSTMTQLKSLHLAYASDLEKFTGIIFNMTWLTGLTLIMTASSRYLSPKISKLMQLRSLTLHHCGFVALPDEDIFKLTNLNAISTLGNSFSWVHPRLASLGTRNPLSSVQGGYKLPSQLQEPRKFREFSQVYSDLYDTETYPV